MKTPSFPDRELHEAIAYALLPGIGSQKYREGVERHGSASASLQAHKHNGETREALKAARNVIERAAAGSISLVVLGEASYPSCLLELHDPPCFFSALGDAGLMARRRVGIVGTRNASASGERIARSMAEMIVRAGAVVVSGMAFGIDAAAHRGALDAGGGTIAVLGSGVDVPYPPRHRDLHRQIVEQGLVISEAPIGSRPVMGAFPKRNRIIGALSEVLVVIEAGERSGALITSRHALELGRTVAAVPGPIDSPRHVGSNRLLADGAAFIGQIGDVLLLAELNRYPTPDVAESSHDVSVSDESQRAILDVIRTGVREVDVLAQTTSLSPRDFSAALTALEMAGRLQVTPGGAVLST